MRTRKTTIWIMVSMFFPLGLPVVQATVVLNDGGIHTLNWTINDGVNIKNSPLNYPTTLNLVTGGWIKYWLYVYDSSQANISGGRIDWFLNASNNSLVRISGGLISGVLSTQDDSYVDISDGLIGAYLQVCQNSHVSISGGSLGSDLYTFDSSQLDISGGTIGGSLITNEYSQITIYGSGFNHPYGILTGTGLLTGILANGDLISNHFQTYSYSRIILVPEPTMLLLLGLGAVIVGKKRYEQTP